VVVSKVGYLQGENYELSQERKKQGKPFKELVRYADGLEHCIHPEFLEDQLGRSLDRLSLTRLDFYLLHNPEYYLSWAAKNDLALEEAQRQYYNRIERAFQHLETEVERGRIRYYGISSNTFPSPAAEPEFTSLERIWKIAESISSKHHFRLAQLPLNLLETGGVTEKNQASGQSVIEFALNKKIGVLINRPLNAIGANRLVRFAEVQATQAASPNEVAHGIDDLIHSEGVLQQRVLPQLNLTPSLQAQVLEQISIGEVLKQNWHNFGTYERWQELREYYFEPRIKGVVQFMEKQESLPESLFPWMQSHREIVESALRAITSVYQQQAAEKSARIKTQVAAVDADWAEASTLSQMALRALRSTSGISNVLLGMRRESYVDDVVEELGRPVSRKERTESWRKLQDIKV
jgi:aryl-alcohol dehydrogenase-like predicted oxidoreductase